MTIAKRRFSQLLIAFIITLSPLSFSSESIPNFICEAPAADIAILYECRRQAVRTPRATIDFGNVHATVTGNEFPPPPLLHPSSAMLVRHGRAPPAIPAPHSV